MNVQAILLARNNQYSLHIARGPHQVYVGRMAELAMLVTTTLAAERLGVTRQRVHALIKAGQLPVVRLGPTGKTTLIPRQALLKLIGRRDAIGPNGLRRIELPDRRPTTRKAQIA